MHFYMTMCSLIAQGYRAKYLTATTAICKNSFVKLKKVSCLTRIFYKTSSIIIILYTFVTGSW